MKQLLYCNIFLSLKKEKERKLDIKNEIKIENIIKKSYI